MIERITYTQKQENQLIEMASKLFPEYSKIHIQGAWIYFDNGVVPSDSIPIFEFCNNWLSDRILANKITRTTKDKLLKYFWNINLYWFKSHPEYVITYVCEEALHPIDYLYFEFKKLKL
jgi:hypothetical protein